MAPGSGKPLKPFSTFAPGRGPVRSLAGKLLVNSRLASQIDLEAGVLLWILGIQSVR
jgi:hypothetical protein